MREILFRGRRRNGEWIEGNYIFWNKKHYIYDGIYYEVIPETIGQYTGLRDNTRTEEYPNGKKIFEGDVIKEGCNGLIGVVIWDNTKGTYGLKDFGESYKIEDAHIEWEVIGNIHDNPELLRKEDEGK